MDFQELLDHADYNATEVKYTSGGVKRYSCVLPPPKKVPKANVQSDNIKRFLEKKKAEEAAKLAEAQKQKEQLLALRAQNTKSNKKAKIMASRTKDNDFSKIRLTEDEVEANKKREEAILKKNLADKVERMKARIEMEEKEKLLPKKRKRKSKHGEVIENVDDRIVEVQNDYKESNNQMRGSDSNLPRKDTVRKPKPPPPLSFNDLLKIAEKKQFEPLQLPVKKKEEERLMSKKERKLMEEEKARLKRKQERLSQGGSSSKPSSVQASSVNKKDTSEKVESKKPVVIHVGKDVSKSGSDSTKFKIPPRNTINTPTNKNVPVKHKDKNANSKFNNSSSNAFEKTTKNPLINGQRKLNKLREESGSSFKDAEFKQNVTVPKKNGLKANPVQSTSNKTPKLDEAALKASLEKEIREKIEKELEEKIAAKFAQLQSLQSKANEKVAEVPKQVKKEPETGNNIAKKIEKPVVNSRKDMERLIAMKKQAMQQKNLKPKFPEKKPFHPNPYLDPPRRLLEPQRPPRPPMKRRIESDDDEDDEDDMNDFIVPSQNEDNYSEYIRQMFRYDPNKYVDEDDDDIMESSFAQQMKEEVRSAKLGYLEDLEEERKERLEMQRKKKKKLKK